MTTLFTWKEELHEKTIDKGLRNTIFSPFSKRRPREDCEHRGLGLVYKKKECKGGISTRIYSNVKDIATTLNKRLFEYDSKNAVNILSDNLYSDLKQNIED